MRKTGIDYLKSGMKVARPVYDSNGRLLLASGITLTENFIQRLSDLGISSLYVEDGVFDGELESDGVVSFRTRQQSVRLLRETCNRLERQGCLDTRSVRRTVDSLIDEILSNYGTLVDFYEIRTFDDYTFDHSVNVCLLSLLGGITLGYNRLQLRELGIGALLHDIGKVFVSKDILNKPGALNPEELQRIRRHPEDGFNILRKQHDIPLPAAHIALQHQERLDGSGYPRRLAGDGIHPYARLVMVADVFDALTSDRPYRKAYPVHQSLDFLESQKGKEFEGALVEAIFSHISPFPAGTVVRLNTGEIGQVVRTDKSALTQPVVRLFFDARENRLRRPLEIDLAAEPGRAVMEVLSEEEIARLVEGRGSGPVTGPGRGGRRSSS